MTTADAVLTGAIFVVAVLYAAVGQAGASGYLAAMGAAGIDPAVMKPAALALNLTVSAIGVVQFRRAGWFSWRLFYPFGVLGFPFSLVGGALHLPAAAYYPAVGGVLLLAAGLMARSARRGGPAEPSAARPPPFWAALGVGAAIGFVSGVTGTGGGVFLAPVILAFRWIDIRRAAAVTAAYNLLNSAAALAGASATLGQAPAVPPWWLAAAAAGGLIGSALGGRRLPEAALRGLLAGVLALSGFRLLLP